MSDLPTQIGDFRIIKELGKGATATVYLAESPAYPEPVALKYIRFADKSKDEAKWNRRLLKLLKAERAVASRLNHPHIIRIFEGVVGTNEAYVVMEYFPGESLERFCTFSSLLPVHRTIGIIFKCCMALDYAYRQGVVHRDIKPANILVDDKDNVKITDFGLAMNINKRVDTDSTFIMGVGSPAYMSPEQIKAYPLNQKTDLYSLGVVLFHLLTGRLPFRAKNPAQLIYKIINADPPAVSQLLPDLPELMDKVIRKSLEKDLYSRYKNGAEFAKDLSAVRYQLVDDKFLPPDTSRFSTLRKLTFFTEFDDVDVWEALRISSWRTVKANTTLIREGDQDQRFGLVITGKVELAVAGKRIVELGEDEVFGETAYLDELGHKHLFSVVTLTDVTYLEVNPAALALSTEESQDLFRRRLTTTLTKRLGILSATVAKTAPAATAGQALAPGLDLQLIDD
ncbi:serine/threonine protein kinase [Denitromonas sp.]|uniref:serine/threonine protein kinase n=1 Tax=Denitromonas sp. TaxID=2734609 RepID=UPI002AFF923B|nr:protein kinase [Denitromonas sp.]